ncbi:MAG: type II toxin-antitoxin system VapC family toxin [Pseudomonadota bacterium]
MTVASVVTYVDADVLIAAARASSRLHRAAIRILDDPARMFVASEFLRLEVVPKPAYEGRRVEAEFYEAFFEAVSRWAENLDAIVRDALARAMTNGLGAMDALHVAAAIALGADELITGERPASPLNRVTAIRIRTLYVPPFAA